MNTTKKRNLIKVKLLRSENSNPLELHSNNFLCHWFGKVFYILAMAVILGCNASGETLAGEKLESLKKVAFYSPEMLEKLRKETKAEDVLFRESFVRFPSALPALIKVIGYPNRIVIPSGNNPESDPEIYWEYFLNSKPGALVRIHIGFDSKGSAIARSMVFHWEKTIIPNVGP